ncbi:cytochrome b5 domain-containing protein [Candidatus Uhrbacteria bacterium]|nr:cytochrome b5 domain-containing protein [Candidatus Uhrbacteria bacterium]
MNKKSVISIILASALIIGGGYIIYAERPVMKLSQSQVEQNTTSQTSSNQEKDELAYTMTDISSHNVPENCWSVVKGNVYDLTSRVTRHPGGEKPIKGLCGIDATSAFERKHGLSKNPNAALALLKIGVLK